MPIPLEYNVDDVIGMLKNDKSFGGANIYMSTEVMHSVGEELGTIDNLSRNQLVNQQYLVYLINMKNGGYEQPEVPSEETRASADADVTRSAASLAITSLLVHHAGRK